VNAFGETTNTTKEEEDPHPFPDFLDPLLKIAPFSIGGPASTKKTVTQSVTTLNHGDQF